MTSQYLNQPTRSEAEVKLERVDRLRLQLVGLENRIRTDLKAMGAGETDLRWLSLIDCFNDAASGIEKEAREAIEEDETRLEFEHEAKEMGLLMAGSGVQFGKVA